MLKNFKLTRIVDDRKTAITSICVLLLAISTVGVGLAGMWYYTSESYMVMAGDSEITIGLNGYFKDPGVEARISGRDVTSKVDVDSALDEGTPGTYEIVYSAGNFHEIRKVRVLDHMSPELKLSGGDVDIMLGEEFKEPGYSARSEEGEDLTDRVKIGKINDKRAGKRKISYSITDDAGRTTRLYRTLNIRENKGWGSKGLPICMFHYVYDELDPPDDLNRRYGNYISLQALQEEVDWLKSEDFYFPSWEEVRDYVDGRLILPEKSVVLTFDDGEKATLQKLMPFVDKNKIPVTSFMITSKNGEEKIDKYASEYITYESHTHDMHKGGGVPGHRGLFPVIDETQGLADLETSIEICRSHDAFAYPYGDYSESAKAMLKKAGFLCAVTTMPGRVYPGDDPLLLNRQRMSLGQSLASFQSKVAPQ